ncbi:signal transduction histidine kinase [Crossiella equi]|uniref:Signal transduction histidine kinase n=1 Tax=Crossiella equi TaxID=130796 RepID=A0ABS5A5Q7_9PSEU|nr:sensor histidine kinase [Crossiella equi]MBP2471572.1 signal transduction histidine kinase [Crossiella equi]
MTQLETRWGPLVTVGPYVLLAALAAVIATVREEPTTDLVLCGVLGLWLLAFVTVRPVWHQGDGPRAVFVTGLLAVLAVLVVRAPEFGFFAPVGYLFVFRLLRWPWQPVGVAVMAVLAGTAQASGIDKSTAFGWFAYAAVVACNVLAMCGYAWFARRLDEATAENAALHERLLVQAREAGVREERQRMAREIHDTLAQGLTGIISQLRATEHAEDRHVAAAAALARESLAEARRSVHALRPEPLCDNGLGEALAEVAQRWSVLHGIPVRVTTTGQVRPVPPEAEAALLRVAQEALANVAKHAQANRVGVTLSYLAEETALDVRDDGRGFDPASPGPGFGLTSMRQRMAGLAGTLAVESEPGAGTGISARVGVGT